MRAIGRIRPMGPMNTEHACCHHEHPPAPVIAGATYTCPMHPEVEQQGPGACPICGMARETKTISAAPGADGSELRDMSRRLWIGAALTLPVFLLAMSHLVPKAPAWLSGDASRWIQFVLTTRGSLGRLAVFRARRAIVAQPEPQYVYPYRHRGRRRLALQLRGN